jgi:hypothetical protein
MGKLTLYIPDNKQEVVEKAKLLATVLHESLSNLIIDFLERYLEEHKELSLILGAGAARACVDEACPRPPPWRTR